jgi:hypothetical protein
LQVDATEETSVSQSRKHPSTDHQRHLAISVEPEGIIASTSPNATDASGGCTGAIASRTGRRSGRTACRTAEGGAEARVSQTICHSRRTLGA